jgi:phenylpropionate dioxygenase-like ring-hydroxylating dioxygenase large terminal subunit
MLAYAFNLESEIGDQKSAMPELDLPQRQATDTLMLTGFWYRALPADGVGRNQLHKAMLLEIPLVIGRDRQGRPFALRDSCPHRGMPLNSGKFDGENLECPYHGWQFDVHNGQCQLIPSLTSDQTMKVDRIYAGSYPCEEQDHFIWVYIPDPGPQSAGFSKPAEGRNAGQHRSRHHRPDGSCARTVRPPGVVVAHPSQHSRKKEELRANSQRISHGCPHPKLKFRALPAVTPVRRCRFDCHHD